MQLNLQLWGDITKGKRRDAIEALKEAYEEPANVWRVYIYFRSDHADDNAPSAQIGAVGLLGIIGEKDVIGDEKKKSRRRK